MTDEFYYPVRQVNDWRVTAGVALVALAIGLAIMYAVGVYYAERTNAGNRHAS